MRVVVSALCLSSLPLLAAEPSARELNSGWQFRILSGPDAGSTQAELKAWHPAQVPGVVQTDLLASHLIPDPFYRDNESRLQWIGLSDWEYRTTFQVDAATLAREHVDLVFDGLDTFAEVFLNDQPVLQSDNMFRRWRIAAKPLLQAGPNTLRIVFHSPITSMIPKVKALPYILPSISTAERRQRRERRDRSVHAQGALSVWMGLGSALRHDRHLEAGAAGDVGHAARRELSHSAAEDHARVRQAHGRG